VTDPSSIEWKFDIASDTWDRLLAAQNGHPLQSALWGDARNRADGVEDRRWAAFADGEPVWMGRFEIRRLPLHGRVAWLPRGPVPMGHPLAVPAHRQFLDHLKKAGYLICFEDPYPSALAGDVPGIPLADSPKTLWVDLRKGRDLVFKAMHRNLRYGVRAAERAGVVLEETRSPEDVTEFFRICGTISEAKDFPLPGSERLLHELIALSRPDSPFKAHLFVARCDGSLASGYFSLENGRTLHNLWNGTDRSFARKSPGEAALWHQVAWGMDSGLRMYDQEGIDEERNPGCYEFKKRLGGEEVALPGLRAHPLGMVGKAVLAVGRRMGKV